MSRVRSGRGWLRRELRGVADCCARHPAATIALWRAFVLAIIVLIALEVRALAIYPVVNDTVKLPRATPAVIAVDAVVSPSLASARARG